MSLKSSLFIYYFLAGLCSATEVDVYLFGGQSNMVGQGIIEELTEDQKVIPDDVYYWQDGEFKPLVLGAFPTANRRRPERFGPEISFAQHIVADRPVYIVKYGNGGKALHHGWHKKDWAGGAPVGNTVNFYPGEFTKDRVKGALYQIMIKHYQSAIANLVEQGLTPVVKGFLWMQGEQDSLHEVSAAEYAESLERLHRRVKEDLQVDSLILAFGQVLPDPETVQQYPYRASIREEMRLADGRSGSPKAIAEVFMVSTDNCPLRADKVHYNTEGIYQLGINFAEIVNSQLID